MGRKRKPKQSPAPITDKPVQVGTDLGSLLRAAMAEPSAAGKRRASRKPGKSVKPAKSAKPTKATKPTGPAATVPGRVPRSAQVDAVAVAVEPVPLGPADLRRLHDAYAGVTPMGRGPLRPGAGRAPAPRHALPPDSRSEEDVAARARLGALVGEGQRFTIERDEDGRVAGLRQGAQRALLKTLRSQRFKSEAELDLHGMRSEQAAAAVTRFVRARHRAGARYLMIIHGAGIHSEGGVGVLAERTVEELTRGGAAPLVHAFATAHSRRGGLGALAVYLK